jgi:hypothetical protein
MNWRLCLVWETRSGSVWDPFSVKGLIFSPSKLNCEEGSLILAAAVAVAHVAHAIAAAAAAAANDNANAAAAAAVVATLVMSD